MVHIIIKDISVSRGNFMSGLDGGVQSTANQVTGDDYEAAKKLKKAKERDLKRSREQHNWQNTIMLSLEAIQELFFKTGLSGTDMDMIVLASQLPEYIAPATSVKIHNVIGGKRECICYDVNSNGCGMTLAFDQISKYMAVNPYINRALLIGCDYMNMKDSISGDAACAILLEKTEEESGVFDAVSIIGSSENDSYLIPQGGFSNIFKFKENIEYKFSLMKVSMCDVDAVEESVTTILSRNGLEADNIKSYCFSQSSREGLELIRERLHLHKAISPYIGDLYGDTGTCGPFITLYEALEKQLINRGDYYLICAFGCSAQNITLLCRM